MNEYHPSQLQAARDAGGAKLALAVLSRSVGVALIVAAFSLLVISKLSSLSAHDANVIAIATSGFAMGVALVYNIVMLGRSR